MNGNLSKKKGFLGQLEEDDLASISDILEERYGDRLNAAESDILTGKQQLEKTKNELKTYTDEMVDEAYAGIEELEKSREKVSNKIIVAEDDGTYWSAAMTDMKIYQIIEEHIVQDLNEPRMDKIPSTMAVFDEMLSLKQTIDDLTTTIPIITWDEANEGNLATGIYRIEGSNGTYTILFTASMSTVIRQILLDGDKLAARIKNNDGDWTDSSRFITQSDVDEIMNNLMPMLEAKEDVSNKVITEDEVTETAPYFSVEATKAYVTEAIRVMKDSLIKYISEQLANFEGGGSDYVAYAETKVENGVLSLFENSSLGSVLSASIIGDVLSITQARNIYTTNIENNVLTFA